MSLEANRTLKTFPKEVRLSKAADFSSVFKAKRPFYSPHFVVYLKTSHAQETNDGAVMSGASARLGIVIGRRQVPLAVTRNLIKRIVREIFRQYRSQLKEMDLIFRVHKKIAEMPLSALKQVCFAEIEDLFSRLPKKEKKHA